MKKTEQFLSGLFALCTILVVIAGCILFFWFISPAYKSIGHKKYDTFPVTNLDPLKWNNITIDSFVEYPDESESFVEHSKIPVIQLTSPLVIRDTCCNQYYSTMVNFGKGNVPHFYGSSAVPPYIPIDTTPVPHTIKYYVSDNTIKYYVSEIIIVEENNDTTVFKFKNGDFYRAETRHYKH